MERKMDFPSIGQNVLRMPLWNEGPHDHVMTSILFLKIVHSIYEPKSFKIRKENNNKN